MLRTRNYIVCARIWRWGARLANFEPLSLNSCHPKVSADYHVVSAVREKTLPEKKRFITMTLIFSNIFYLFEVRMRPSILKDLSAEAEVAG